MDYYKYNKTICSRFPVKLFSAEALSFQPSALGLLGVFSHSISSIWLPKPMFFKVRIIT